MYRVEIEARLVSQLRAAGDGHSFARPTTRRMPGLPQSPLKCLHGAGPRRRGLRAAIVLIDSTGVLAGGTDTTTSTQASQPFILSRRPLAALPARWEP